MSQTNTVLIYSTLSENCRKLFGIIEPVSSEFMNLTGLRLLCIDSKKIRDIITKSKTVIVDKVPTILVIRQDNGVEMYDGTHAFKWTTNVIEKYIQAHQTTEPVQLLQHSPTPTGSKSVPKQSPEHELEPEEPIRREISKHRKETSENHTSKIKRPPVGVRTDAGNYDFSSEFEEVEEIERKAPSHNIKDNKSGTKDKPGGIMAIAQALQKDRESEKIPIARDVN